ncbi:MAG: peptidoglycan DD-metalloendopeptidase family protein [Clostridia bacterium]|nr:peptidoglycan DD-metalloendopeptidase family protein [Clostridia bacterium]
MLSVLIEPIKILAVAATVTVCAAFMINASSYEVVLGVYANGDLVGYLESKSPMTTALASLESDLGSLIGSEYTVKCDIDYSFVNVKDPKLLNDADCYRTLYNIAASDFVDAYALYVDGDFVAASSEFDTLNAMLRQLTSDDTSGAVKNDIRISNQLCLKSSVMTEEQIAELLALEIAESAEPMAVSETDDINRVEVVEATDRAKELDTLNSGITRFSGGQNALAIPHTLSDGTKITTDKNELFDELELVYVKNETVTEAIPYETTYIESEDYYIGTQMLKTTGREGSAEVVYEIEYDKHGEISRTAISRTVTNEPVTEVMVIGTSKAPTVNPSGNFVWPTAVPKGISSYYGGRQLFGNYDFHLGVDILNSYGNDIWAADSGTVTYAGYNGSYGYYVTIEHADGYSTLYAHMSKLYTETGAEVKQGDVIGAIGKTGVATAYHLHFEVRIDGKTVNPLDYLPERE